MVVRGPAGEDGLEPLLARITAQAASAAVTSVLADPGVRELMRLAPSEASSSMPLDAAR